MRGRIERDIRSLPGVLACASEGPEIVVLADSAADRRRLEGSARRLAAGTPVRVIGGRAAGRSARMVPAGIASVFGVGTAASALLFAGWGAAPPAPAPAPPAEVRALEDLQPLPSLFGPPASLVTTPLVLERGEPSAAPALSAREPASRRPLRDRVRRALRAPSGSGATVRKNDDGGARVRSPASGEHSRGRHLGHTRGKGHAKARGKGHAHHRHG